MRLIFNDLGSAISIKSCYSRFLSSIALILLMVLLSAALLVGKNKNENVYADVTKIILADN